MTEELRIVVRAEAQRAVNELKKLEGASVKAESSAQGLMAGLSKFAIPAAAAAAAFAGLVAVGRESLGIFRENEQAAARLSAVLRATGGAAGISAGELGEWRQELFDSTLLTTQQIDTMSSLLLTFRNISGDVFPRAQRAVADMSMIFGSLDGAAVQLGRALQEPANGITALRRVGITFSEEQQNQIRNFEEMNDLASAQAIILEEIENQVGGTAQAMTELSTAGFDRMTRAMDDLKSSFGAFIAENFGPTINTLAETLESAVSRIDRVQQGRQIRSEGGRGTTTQEAMSVMAALDQEIEFARMAAGHQGGNQLALERYNSLLRDRQRMNEHLRNLAMEEELIARRTAEQARLRAIAEAEHAELKAEGLLASAETLKNLLNEEMARRNIREEVEELNEETLLLISGIGMVADSMEGLVKDFGEIGKAAEGNKLADWATSVLDSFEQLQEEFGGLFDAASGVYSAWNDLEANRHEIAMNNMKSELAERLAAYDQELFAARQAGQDTTNIEQQRLTAKLEMEEKIARKEEEYRRKAFEQRKMEMIATATMQAALAALNALANIPAPFNIGAALAIGGMAAGQIAMIAGQQYPAMAEGGIVRGPTMAMVGEGGEPEMVLPLSKARQFGFGGGSGVNIIIQGDVIGVPRDEFIRDINRRLSSLQRLGVA